MNGSDDLIGKLKDIAKNLWWTWHPEVIAIFQQLDPLVWRETNHNPILFLDTLSRDLLEQRVRQLGFETSINYQYRRLQEYLTSRDTWGHTHAGPLLVKPVAYFCAEFGIHESLPIYSGGLGVLAGDHLKSSSDLGVPLVGVGLLYRQGYFRQRLDVSGWQSEEYGGITLEQLPLEHVRTGDGRGLTVEVEVPGAPLRAGVWRARVGRNSLLLLDTDIDGNSPDDRALCARLYGGDRRTRIRQELVLGILGMRALAAVGARPGVLHLNEGHSSFALIEKVRELVEEDGYKFGDACRATAIQSVFTTHTPVPAGHDRFAPDLVEQHLGWLRQRLGVSQKDFLGLGRVNVNDEAETFCMTVLALKLTRRANAVSHLHGHVSRKMWQPLWPGRREERVPIGHVTNGVHALSWLAPSMYRLFERHLGHRWEDRICHPDSWDGLLFMDDGELWETHQALARNLVEFARRRLVEQAKRRNEPWEGREELTQALDPEILTIGFARRFATYKRATLLFDDMDRLRKMINHPKRPLQVVFAGKAHPHDDGGKKLIQQIAQLTRDVRFLGRIVFLEDYDINVARHMVQGVDLWVNNPERPLEACGTSGEKVLLNGVLNCSILDGWWAEAYDGSNGFAISEGRSHVDSGVQRKRDADSLYDTLENVVSPLYYDRDEHGVPRGWVKAMKRAIQSLAWRFNADRMVMDYLRESYLPAAGGTSCAMP